jgi:hypothetical protein
MPNCERDRDSQEIPYPQEGEPEEGEPEEGEPAEIDETAAS